VHKPGHISQLELQINNLEKVTDKHQNQAKLLDLKERLIKEINSRKFNLEPKQVTPEVTVKYYETISKKAKFHCKMNQIPANSNGATTGHKLQGMSKISLLCCHGQLEACQKFSRIGNMLSYHMYAHCWEYTLLNQ
jgi:hypothetical protein